MKTKIDWERAALNGLRATLIGASRVLVVSGRLTLVGGRLLRDLSMRIPSSPGPDKPAG